MKFARSIPAEVIRHVDVTRFPAVLGRTHPQQKILKADELQVAASNFLVRGVSDVSFPSETCAEIVLSVNPGDLILARPRLLGP